MSTAAERLEDGFPHGTPDGYTQGCKGRCPAGIDHGLSCKRAKQLAAGDYQYQRLARGGATPAEIADALGLHPAIDTATTPKPKPAPPLRPTAPPATPSPHPAPAATTSKKWNIRHAWVAFDPAGVMQGPFASQVDAMTFVTGKLTAAAAPASPGTTTPSARQKRRRMTEDDLAQIRTLNAEGISDSEIARRIGRTQAIVSSWRRRLGLPATSTFGGNHKAAS